MADDHERRPCGCHGRYYSGIGWDWDLCMLHAWLAEQEALTGPLLQDGEGES